MPENKIQVKLNPDVLPTGSDLAVCNAARRSFNTRSDWDYVSTTGIVLTDNPDRHLYITEKKLKPKDKRLIEFLARGMTAKDFDDFRSDMSYTAHYEYKYDGETNLVDMLWKWRNTPTHDTPFNHCFISFEVKAPIFVARQLVKHEYLIMSEFSRRYKTDDIEFYEPDVWRKAAEDKKQGSSDEEITHVTWDIGDGEVGGEVNTVVEDYNQACLDTYKAMINCYIAPEQARMVLPQSTMTEWTWSGTLGAFAKMCQLRLHPEAQYEARLVAKQVYDYLEEYYPVSAKALVEGV